MNRDTQRNFRFILFVIILGFALMRSCQKPEQPPRQAERTPTPRRTARPQKTPRAGVGRPMPFLPNGQDNSNALLGMPSPAGRGADDYKVERAQYTMSYNRGDGGPNWVSWHLDSSTMGDADRSDFRPDPDLPADWQIRPSDYRGSGYDRGHVCPSADRTASEEDNEATFFMSNMLPQTAALNQKLWKSLEEYSRDLAQSGNELYIVAGGIGSKERIGRGKVNVPQQCWKIIVALPAGEGDLSRLDQNTRVIAVLMPNEQSKRIEQADWREYATSVAQIERATGLDFFSAVPANVRRTLETKVER
jgi:endonuclease G, mitochondrial